MIDNLKDLNLIRGVTHTEWGTVHTYSTDDDTIRFAVYWYDDDDDNIYFSNLYVDPIYRNLGIAIKIFNWVFDYAKVHAFKDVILNVKKDSWMQHWYERLGFEYFEDCDGDYCGNVWMIKSL